MAIQEAPPKLGDSVVAHGIGATSPPIAAPSTSHRPPARRPSLSLLVLALLALLLIIGSVLIVDRLANPSRVPSALPAKSTVVSVRTVGREGLVMRTARGAIDYVALSGKWLLTQDSQTLDPARVRVGDSIMMPSPRVLVDTAQTGVSVQGITASSPGPEGDVMTVEVSSTRTILVDISSQTLINGKRPSVDSRMAIRDAAPVGVVGILDKTLDEMTQAETIHVATMR